MEGLLGGLIGSVLTVVATKLLGMLAAYQRHNHDLRLTFFEKKLAVAEAAIGTMYRAQGALGASAAILEQIVDQPSARNLLGLVRQQMKDLTEATNAAQDTAAAFPLYFDVDGATLFQSDQLSALYGVIADMNATQSAVVQAGLDLDSALATANEPAAREAFMSLIECYRSELRDFGKVLGESSKSMKGVILQVREEMRRFEPR